MARIPQNLGALTILIFIFVNAGAAQFELILQPLCYALDAHSVIAKDMLYFMGGGYTFLDGVNDTTQPSIYAIPLNNTFNAEGYLGAGDYYSASAPSGEFFEGAFFKDASEDLLYDFAGFADNDLTATNNLQTFEVDSWSWNTTAVVGGDFNMGQRAAPLVAISEGTQQGLGFITGGGGDIPGMVTFDSNALTWINQTDETAPSIQRGFMTFTRFGENGTLIVIGGFNHYENVTNYLGSYWDFRPMSNIGVYDVATQTWYNVTATGDVPEDRANFCGGISTAPDNSSINILIYGGYNRLLDRGYSDTYILSLPSFRWINVTDTSSANTDLALDSYSLPVGRRGHTCQMYRDRSLISIGGDITFGPNPVNEQSCNASWSSIRVFDASTLTWQEQFLPNISDYYVPDKVVHYIGGDDGGNAVLSSPSAGWPPGLGSVFETMVPYYNASAHIKVHHTHHSNTDTGAIAAGVVLVVALICFGILALWYRRHRQTKLARENKAKLDSSSTTAAAEMGAGEVVDKKGLVEADGQNIVEADDGGGGWKDRHAVGKGVQELEGKERPHEMEGEGGTAHELEGLIPTREKGKGEVSELPA